MHWCFLIKDTIVDPIKLATASVLNGFKDIPRKDYPDWVHYNDAFANVVIFLSHMRYVQEGDIASVSNVLTAEIF